jgi:hypothetical protein
MHDQIKGLIEEYSYRAEQLKEDVREDGIGSNNLLRAGMLSALEMVIEDLNELMEEDEDDED